MTTSISARVAAADFNGAQAMESWAGIDFVSDDYFEKVFPKNKQGCDSLENFLDRLKDKDI